MKSSPVSRFILITFIFFTYAFSDAANLNGTISRLKSGIAFKNSTTQKKYLLTYKTTEIQKQINKLKELDFISVDGSIDEGHQTLLANTVNYVGLKELLGRWNADDEFCYNFKTFTELAIYRKTLSDKCNYNVLYLAREMTYTINPTTDNWLVLISDSKGSYVMDLVLKSKNKAEINLYDPDTGDILKEIKLRK